MSEAHAEVLAAKIQQRTLEVGILLFPDVEILDFAGSYEVFSVAARVAKRDRLLPHPAFRVRTIAAESTLLTVRHGLRVMPDAGFVALSSPRRASRRGSA